MNLTMELKNKLIETPNTSSGPFGVYSYRGRFAPWAEGASVKLNETWDGIVRPCARASMSCAPEFRAWTRLHLAGFVIEIHEDDLSRPLAVAP